MSLCNDDIYNIISKHNEHLGSLKGAGRNQNRIFDLHNRFIVYLFYYFFEKLSLSQRNLSQPNQIDFN